MQASSEQIIAGIVRAREEARVRVDQAAEVAAEVATLDSDLQASTDTLQRARLANALRFTAAACDVAEQRAVRAVFSLRLAERSLEDAHARMVWMQREDAERARVAAGGW